MFQTVEDHSNNALVCVYLSSSDVIVVNDTDTLMITIQYKHTVTIATETPGEPGHGSQQCLRIFCRDLGDKSYLTTALRKHCSV